MKPILNIVLPIAGSSVFFDTNEYTFPKPLIEINGKTMIELVINNLSEIPVEKRFVFILKTEDCQKFHIDNTVRLLTNDNCQIIYVNGDTRGATCTALLAVEIINNDDPLIISNSDQIIEMCLSEAYSYFISEHLDAAVVSFESVHPKWSYVRLDDNNRIIETAEKRPISKNAIAGLYYFRSGKSFVEAAYKSIEKDASVNGSYFIAPVFNELVLSSKLLGVYRIENKKYHSFYSPKKIQEYEKTLLI